MQAITTKVLPCTNTKPTRIKAECERGSLTVCVDCTSEATHRAVVRVLCERFAYEDEKQYGSHIESNPWIRPFVTGQSKDGNYQHVFTA